MSTPQRGLPPPTAVSSITIPSLVTATTASQYSNLPPPPDYGAGSDEQMKLWLSTKAEEEKRKQEEEKTRQASYKLEQRRIEQSMLQESIRSGVPPALLPIIFAGLGGNSPSSVSAELIQQYVTQAQSHRQQTSSPRPTQAVSATVGQREGYGESGLRQSPFTQTPPAQQPPLNQGQALPNLAPLVNTSSAHPFIPFLRTPAAVPGIPTMEAPPGPRPSFTNVLPRLATSEIDYPAHVQRQDARYEVAVPNWATLYGTSAPLSSLQFVPYVHPVASAGSTSQMSTPDYSISPRKRKSTSYHQQHPHPMNAPAPTTDHPFRSEPSSTASPSSGKGSDHPHKQKTPPTRNKYPSLASVDDDETTAHARTVSGDQRERNVSVKPSGDTTRAHKHRAEEPNSSQGRGPSEARPQQ